MHTIIVPLRDIVVDPNQDTDLTTLPEDGAISLIWKAISFLPPQEVISIQNIIGAIRVPFTSHSAGVLHGSSVAAIYRA